MSTSKNYLALLPRPSPESINSGLSNLKASTCLRVFGEPAKEKSVNGSEVTSPKLKKALVAEDLDLPYDGKASKVRGHRMAVESLKRVLYNVERADPELREALGHAGMLNARLVRGSKSTWSNHSWGFAIDITINGFLDARGDNKVQAGLLTLYKYFRAEGWFWGAEFNTEDAMHFEVAEETFLRWEREGKL
jgi:hypothetical protein